MCGGGGRINIHKSPLIDMSIYNKYFSDAGTKQGLVLSIIIKYCICLF